jgi:hypothetical protein
MRDSRSAATSPAIKVAEHLDREMPFAAPLHRVDQKTTICQVTFSVSKSVPGRVAVPVLYETLGD